MQAILSNDTLRQYLAWIQKGGFAVLDQGLFAGTNFLVGVLLARWLEPVAYGAFSTAYSIFLFMGTLHAALWTEPMLVYGSGRFRKQYHHYQKVLLIYHWRFGLVSSTSFAILSIIFFTINQPELGQSFAGLGIASPFILYLWLVRRSAYVLLKPQYAALGGGLYLVLYLGLSFLLFQINLLNEISSLCTMAIAAAGASGIAQIQIKAEENKFQDNLLESDTVINLHLQYGKWALVASGLSWVPLNLYYIVIPFFNGLQASAMLKALMNLIMPILQFNAALAGLFVPVFTRSLNNGKTWGYFRKGLLMLTAFSITYWIIIIAFGNNLFSWLYGGKFPAESYYFILIGSLPVISSWVNTFGALLKSLEKPNIVALSYALAAIVSVIAIIIIVYIGFAGALIGMIASLFGSAGIMAYFINSAQTEKT